MTSIRTNLSLTALLILLAGIPCAIAGQERPRSYRDTQAQPPIPAAPSTQSASPNVLFSSDEDYRIGATDVLQVTVQDAPELSNTLRVNASGMIPMPFLGQLKAAGKTAEELAKQITNGLRGEYLTDPQVTVIVVQYNSRSLFIQGAVRNPGVYIIEGRPSLLKLITMAGGLAENHGSTAFVIREIKRQKAAGTASALDQSNKAPGQSGGVGTVRTAADTQASVSSAVVEPAAATANSASATSNTAATDPATADEEDAKYEMKQVNINSLLRGNFSQNLVIQPGDIINIPQGDIFFVAGEVRSPGSYPLKDGTTLRQAVSMAQGITFKAKAASGVIFREDSATGKRQEIKVDIGQIMSGKQEDIPIQANDVVIVPNSRFKSAASTVLNAFGVNAARLPMAY
jgi:polysaccharide export outer membrane protein